MRGEFQPIWARSSDEIWQPLLDYDRAPASLTADLYTLLHSHLDRLQRAKEQAARGNVAGTPAEIPVERKVRQARQERGAELAKDLGDDAIDALPAKFQVKLVRGLRTESEIICFMESVFETLEEFSLPGLTDLYLSLWHHFIDTYSLRYELQASGRIYPTLPGLLSSFVRNIENSCYQDAVQAQRLDEFKESMRDLRLGISEKRVKNCVASHIIHLESLGATHPDVAAQTLNAMLAEIKDWPHGQVKGAAIQVSSFANKYGGVRHGTSRDLPSRDLTLRDWLSTTMLLAGVTPYALRQFDSEAIYGVPRL